MRQPKRGAAWTLKGKDFLRFLAALEKVCRALALAIVSDGEGASRVVEIEVRGVSSDRAATQIARTIATSPLVKTALAGADPNWGRILAAAGRAGVRFDPARVQVWLAGIKVYGPPRRRLGGRSGIHPERSRRGSDSKRPRNQWTSATGASRPHPFSERKAHHRLLATYVPIVLDLGMRPARRLSSSHSSLATSHWSGCARVWTCDFTTDYVHINADYRT